MPKRVKGFPRVERLRTFAVMKARPIVHRILGVHSSDRVLHHIGPFGLAASVGTCLVVDLDPHAPSLADRTLRQLLDDGPSSSDLGVSPGVSAIGNGGVEYSEAADLIEHLTTVWGRIVLRSGSDSHPYRTLRVEPLLPRPLTPESVDVVQAMQSGQQADGAMILPPIRRNQIRSILDGQLEPRWRWTRAWRPAWSRSWA